MMDSCRGLNIPVLEAKEIRLKAKRMNQKPQAGCLSVIHVQPNYWAEVTEPHQHSFL